MREIKLTVDGKEIKLTPEQIKILGLEEKPCVVDRNIDNNYHCLDSFVSVYTTYDADDDYDNLRYETGNYFRDRKYAEQVALHAQLTLRLLAFSERNGGDSEWNGDNHHSYIVKGNSGNYEVYNAVNCKQLGTVYFNSYNKAVEAIKEVIVPFQKEHPEFVW